MSTTGRPSKLSEELVKSAYGQAISKLSQGDTPSLHAVQKLTGGARETVQRFCEALQLPLRSAEHMQDSDDPRVARVFNRVKDLLIEIDQEHEETFKAERERYAQQMQQHKEQFAESQAAHNAALNERDKQLDEKQEELNQANTEITGLIEQLDVLAASLDDAEADNEALKKQLNDKIQELKEAHAHARSEAQRINDLKDTVKDHKALLETSKHDAEMRLSARKLEEDERLAELKNYYSTQLDNAERERQNLVEQHKQELKKAEKAEEKLKKELAEEKERHQGTQNVLAALQSSHDLLSKNLENIGRQLPSPISEKQIQGLQQALTLVARSGLQQKAQFTRFFGIITDDIPRLRELFPSDYALRAQVERWRNLNTVNFKEGAYTTFIRALDELQIEYER